jgi:hypothetical protein
MAATLPPLALVGPTASGKSAVSLWLAQHYPLEIISVDSALVYRGMDIGTAKPTPAELALVPHHLIDIRDPAQAYSAAEFATDAKRLIADIQARGKHPLLVGGTMLYLKALLHPLDDMPPSPSCAPRWRPKRPSTVGPPCTPNWPWWTPPPPPASAPTTASAWAAPWRCGVPRGGHCPASTPVAARQTGAWPCPSSAWSHRTGPGCTTALASGLMPCWRKAW